MIKTNYKPVKMPLKSVVEEYEVEITAEDATLIHGISTVLDSGVEKLTLKISPRGTVVVDEDCFKSIQCSNVKVKSLSDKGDFDSISDAKAAIQGSYWSFPCPDYKWHNIKRNLEKAICEIHRIGKCVVEDFHTGIVEWDRNEVIEGNPTNESSGNTESNISNLTKDFIEDSLRKRSTKKSETATVKLPLFSKGKNFRKIAEDFVEGFTDSIVKIYDVVSHKSFLVNKVDIDVDTTERCRDSGDKYGHHVIFVFDRVKDKTPNKSGVFAVSDKTYEKITTRDPKEW